MTVDGEMGAAPAVVFATPAELVAAGTAMGAISLFEAAAIVGALAERRLVDPLKVAAWAEMFAKGQGKELAPETRKLVAEGLNGFALVLRSMVTKPAGGGHARQ
jgi:hypothetical protein